MYYVPAFFFNLDMYIYVLCACIGLCVAARRMCKCFLPARKGMRTAASPTRVRLRDQMRRQMEAGEWAPFVKVVLIEYFFILFK